MSERHKGIRYRTIKTLFVCVYLIVQTAVPVVGLLAAHREEAPMRFSWHMFSRVPDVADE